MKSPKFFKSMGQLHTSHAISGENMWEWATNLQPYKCFPPNINLFYDFSHSLARGYADNGEDTYL